MKGEESERIEGIEKKRSGLKVGVAIAAVGGLLALLCGGGLALLLVFLRPVAIDARDAAEATACARNLQKIHGGLLIYRTKERRLPPESGVAFLAAIYTKGMKPSEANAGSMTCPGVDHRSLAIGGLPWHEWWADPSRLHGDWSSYAGRDMANHPFEKLSGTEPIAACDNRHCQNHADTTNVLYGDGSVQTFSLRILKETGVVPPGADRLVVGPASPVEDLRKLSLD